MNIKLNLRKHCIETEIKKIYNRSVSQYFKSGTDKAQLEKQIDLLKTFLEKSDFSYLRSTYPELAGHSDADVTLKTDGQDRIIILLDDKKIDILIA